MMEHGQHHADVELVRVHDAAGLALVRSRADSVDGGGTTKWIPWPPPSAHHPSFPQRKEPSIELRESDFAPRAQFQTSSSADGHSPQNVLIFLHGRGDNEVPFAKLGAQMALPQTGAVLPLLSVDCAANAHVSKTPIDASRDQEASRLWSLE